METLWKWTDEEGCSYKSTQWRPGLTRTADGGRRSLCNNSWLHAYPDALTALLMDPSCGSYTVGPSNHKRKRALLWECEGEVGLREIAKVGCTLLTTVRVVAWPQVTDVDRLGIALHVFKVAFPPPLVPHWVNHWLNASGVVSPESLRQWRDQVGPEAYRTRRTFHLVRAVEAIAILMSPSPSEFRWRPRDSSHVVCGWSIIADLLYYAGLGLETHMFSGYLACALQMIDKAKSA